MSATLSWKLQNKSNFFFSVFDFFRTLQTCFSTLILTNLKKSLLRIFWYYREKIYLLWFELTFFEKNEYLVFWYKSGFQRLVLHFSLYFKDFFSNSVSGELKELSHAHLLVVTKRKLTPVMRTHINKILNFTPKSIFSYFRDFFSNMSLINLDNSFFTYFGYTLKKITSSGGSEKVIYAISLTEIVISNVNFYFLHHKLLFGTWYWLT